MKIYSRMLLAIAALLIAGIAVLVGIVCSFHRHGTDTVLFNDIVQTLRENWDELDTLDADRFGTELLVFDSEGFLRYETATRKFAGCHSPEEAMQQGGLCLAVSEGSRFLGTAVIPDPDQIQYETLSRRLCITAIAMGLLFLLAGGLYGFFVYRSIILPFRKMERFAVDVAGGNLDEPLMLSQNNLFGAFTHSFDIMREELKEARRRENALKAKEKELVASLSHDLKTPITGIKLQCELMLVKTQDPYVRGKIDSIHQKAEQINVLVCDLLASTLEDLGELNVNCCDEPSLILHELLLGHDTKGLVRESKIPDCLIQADRFRLSQIIGNIISNSYKYAGTEMDVAYRIRDSFLEMSIQDYGGGVPEDELSLLTSKFYRGKNAAGKDGSGLGLYIASELMGRMHGELICSDRNGGFCVTLLLPLS